jgi:hypothetical protein
MVLTNHGPPQQIWCCLPLAFDASLRGAGSIWCLPGSCAILVELTSWRQRGMVSTFLGRYEPALEQFHDAMRLNPLDPQIYLLEMGLGWANFFLRRFEVALSWATKIDGP